MSFVKKIAVYLGNDWVDALIDSLRDNNTNYNECMCNELLEWIEAGADLSLEKGRLFDLGLYGSNYKLIKILIDAGAEIKSNTGISLFVKIFGTHGLIEAQEYSTVNESIKIAKLLWETAFGAPIEIENIPDNITHNDILIYAVSIGDEELVEKLLINSLNPNDYNRYGWTALHYAALYDRPNMVAKLIAAGADPNLCPKIKHWQTFPPIHDAIKHSNKEILSLLLDARAIYPIESAAIFTAIKTNDFEILELLLEAYAIDPNALYGFKTMRLYSSSCSSHLLEYAIETHANANIIQLLLKFGATPFGSEFYTIIKWYNESIHFISDLKELNATQPQLFEELIYKELQSLLESKKGEELLFCAAFLEKIISFDPLKLFLHNRHDMALLLNCFSEIESNSQYLPKIIKITNEIMRHQFLEIEFLNTLLHNVIDTNVMELDDLEEKNDETFVYSL